MNTNINTKQPAFALFSYKGKQYKTFTNDTFLIEGTKFQPGDTFLIKNDIFLIADKDKTLIGTPNLEGVDIQCIALKHVKSQKVVSFHKRRRKNSRTFKYTKPLFSLIRVNRIAFNL